MICYRDIQFSEVSIINELWEKNRAYHENISEYFGCLYADLAFEERINYFSSFDKEHIKITVAEASDNKILLGYSISTFEENEGCIHSLHVAENVNTMEFYKNLGFKGNTIEMRLK